MAWLVALLIIIPWIAALLSAVAGKKRWTIFQRLAALLLFGLLAVLVRAFTETRLTAFEIDGFTWMQWPFGAASASLRIDAISIFFAAPIALIAVGLAWDSWSLSRMISGRPFILVGVGFWFAGLFSADLLVASLCFALAGLSLASIDQGLGADRQSAVRQIWLESSIFFVLIGLAALAEMNDGSFLYSNIGEYESLDMVVSLLVAQSIARLALAAVHNVPAQFSHREAVASRMALFNGTIALYWLARVVVARYNLEITYFPSELSIGIAALAIIATVVVARRTREPAWPTWVLLVCDRFNFSFGRHGHGRPGDFPWHFLGLRGTALAPNRGTRQHHNQRDSLDQQPVVAGIDQLRRLPSPAEQPSPVTSRLGRSTSCTNAAWNNSGR